ncbi:DUF2460 domain-containing protein [Mycobacterium botniense]|uniref:Uncharacterized protein n=1 Tax=Mycobacterium botniense TaxID=84962 RepID=A0A7I9XY08_9MYCO|nr:DUF2460 domain-containing protein [Mycobacterium botniense]GFG74684.1 hypothetical protein MBOT_20490 [Mycobacterium botniense]
MSIYGEAPSGAVNGTNTVFTTSQPFYPGSTRVYVNGERQHDGVDYSEDPPSTLTFAQPPANGAVILVDYDITAQGANYPLGQWNWNPEGYPAGSVLYYGPVLWPAGIDPGSTKTAVMVFGPGGAQANGIPPLAAGQPGPPPQLAIGNVNTLAAGSSATADLRETAPGGPGIPSAYVLDLGLPQGSPGTVGSFLIASAEDLVGTLVNGATLLFNSATGKFNPAPLPFLFAYNVTGIPTTGTSGGQVRTLSSLTIPAQTQPYLPLVFASVEVAGTVNTKVDLVARLGGAPNTQGGAEIGRGFGTLGAAPPGACDHPRVRGFAQRGLGRSSRRRNVRHRVFERRAASGDN